jgi:hypothetical protein
MSIPVWYFLVVSDLLSHSDAPDPVFRTLSAWLYKPRLARVHLLARDKSKTKPANSFCIPCDNALHIPTFQNLFHQTTIIKFCDAKYSSHQYETTLCCLAC